MLSKIPLLVIPLILFNLGLFGLMGADDPFVRSLFTVEMMSGGTWAMTIGDVIVLVALLVLFVEIMKSTVTGMASIIDHLLSTVVFVVYLVEFLLVAGASTSLFFTLMVIALIDVLAGFSVSIRSAGRDINMN
ncbi:MULTISPECIES: hypothetical protein [Nioella]|jgi:hypothetical protein|uniref:hypothetical protein n=1 Tax=Nioella TaxID=1775424 RepID=UPI0008FD6712|nr:MULTISPECIES: hypothetical protein [Nioella]TBX28222.1 membrane protein [Roseovarius sp. JS7-11]